ncbi:MAG: tRNA pseudouridine(55) synthase TruB [Lachnospiraceae bacterium]|nr:tRNA pseudouridine(55) synthase TruB [Lachnospiraceae bacterium]
MINGVINVRKEPGMTSFGVVARLRHITGQKKIGHAGTLDPDAEGVLPVCLGKATKLVPMLTEGGKTYEAEILLGIETDTQDTSGRVLRSQEVSLTEEEIRDAILSFEGTMEQIPPMYSAVKVGGKKLVDLARKGIEVERKPRKVTFSAVEIMHIDPPRACFRVSCGKGAYIRTLCDDIGKKLGCGGAMSHLIRTRVGNFTIEDSVTLAGIEGFFSSGRLDCCVQAIDSFFPELEKILLPDRFSKAALNGSSLPLTGTNPPKDGNKVLVYLSDGTLIGVYLREGTKYSLDTYLHEL